MSSAAIDDNGRDARRAIEPRPPRLPRRQYGASGFRKMFFTFIFLLLLPFFLSLPVMLYQRIAKGVLFDTWGLIVVAVAFTAIMLLLLFELVHSLRSRFDLGAAAFRYTLPASRNIFIPRFAYRTATVPYAEIDAIETHREIYGGLLTPIMMRTASVRTKEGQTHRLGYVSEADMDPIFPVQEIAEELARRSGAQLVHRGNVWRLQTKKMLGLLPASGGDVVEVPDEQIATLNRQHARFMMILVGAMVVLLAAGISIDFLGSSVDRGERARDAVQRSTTR